MRPWLAVLIGTTPDKRRTFPFPAYNAGMMQTGKTDVGFALLLAAACGALLTAGGVAQENAPLRLDSAWKQDGLVTAKFEINGTGSRSNPLRRRLERPFSGDDLFFRFRLRYDAQSIDTPETGDGEFVVFWLDDHEGTDADTHSGGVPNAGVHVSDGRNRFMVRYSPSSQAFSTELAGDRDFLVLGQLSKSTSGRDEPFDRLSVWIDPAPSDQARPHATTTSGGAISTVTWVGFSTGGKTELDDRITVWDIDVADTWHAALGLPSRRLVPPRVAKRTVHFREDVFPILQERCFGCHAGADAEQGIRLDTLDELLNRTSPRNSQASRLYQLVASGKMPPEDERLTEAELNVVRAWIDEGLDWDERLLPTPVPETDHWAFQKIQRPAIPEVHSSSWIRTPIDAFIARRHEALGLQPSARADDQTLDRRVTLDLLGLPPQSVDIEQPAANIDALLSHPAYGERWGRHWLDVARWAESNGHQHNRGRKHAWRYRDWVIEAFNSNKPFDDFVREQIAGDEMTPVHESNLVATGFLAAARYSGNELDKDIQRNDILTDVTDATASAFLGLTFGCARCHTHKFDPISIRDYYRFQAFFAKGQPANVLLRPGVTEVKAVIDERWGLFDSVRARLIAVKRRQGIANPIVIPKTVLAAIKGKQRQRFDQLEKQIEALDQSWAWQSATSVHPGAIAPHDMRFPLPRDPSLLSGIETFLLVRGDVKSPGPVVRPGWPGVFGPTSPSASQPRTALAEWLVSPDHPLTARVWVNRIWQWHFGRGLVETSNDFGSQGTPPSHPELLDFLASELIANDWNTNHIHRLIVDSATYRQSFRYSESNAAIDPDNENYWRWTPRRLEAEAIRDAVLAVAGLLDTTRGGPSVRETSKRRGIYLKQHRERLPYQQQLFDSATGNLSCSRRRVSTTSLQPLWLLNSAFMQQAATDFAKHTQTIERAFESALNREPNADELAILRALKEEHGLSSACLAILNASEFLYLK